jgi:hypothetical protein
MPGSEVGGAPEVERDEVLVEGGEHEADLVHVEVAARRDVEVLQPEKSAKKL